MGESDGLKLSKWTKLFNRSRSQEKRSGVSTSFESNEAKIRPAKWSLGVLDDKETDEVPGAPI